MEPKPGGVPGAGPACDSPEFVWRAALERTEDDPTLAQLMRSLVLVESTDHSVTLEGARMHARIAADRIGELTALFAAATGRQLEVVVRARASAKRERGTGDAPGGPDERAPEANDPSKHPLVEEVVRRFGARVTHVQRRQN
ncbi:MAG: hypothetical protein AAFR38_01830 [Planctomycetota bacterium]